METLKFEVTVTLDNDIVEALKNQRGYTDRHIVQVVKNELEKCRTESGLIFEIKVEKSNG